MEKIGKNKNENRGRKKNEKMLTGKERGNAKHNQIEKGKNVKKSKKKKGKLLAIKTERVEREEIGKNGTAHSLANVLSASNVGDHVVAAFMSGIFIHVFFPSDCLARGSHVFSTLPQQFGSRGYQLFLLGSQRAQREN